VNPDMVRSKLSASSDPNSKEAKSFWIRILIKTFDIKKG
jgi:hypothetical protein